MSKKQDSIATWVWIVTPVLSLAFLGFIYFLSTQPADDDASLVQGEAKNVLKNLNKKGKESTKKIKKEISRYDFYKLLEKQSVDVKDNKNYKSTPKSAELDYEYHLQVASFRSEADADRLRAELILEGMNAYQQTRKVKGKAWYRVMIGPFKNRSKLNHAQDVLASKNISALVLKEDFKK